MTVASPFSILLVYPPPAPAASPVPPATVSQVRQVFSEGSIKTHLWDSGPEGASHGGRRLLDHLEWLSLHDSTIHFLCLNEIEPAQLKDLMKVLEDRRPGLRLSLDCIIDRPITTNDMAPGAIEEIVQIQWRLTGPLPDLRFFKAFSRAGVWNHLVFDGTAIHPENCRAVTLQPNIIHSWETTHAGNGDCDRFHAYDHIRPLPGRPLWQLATDPVNRFLLADRLDKNRLIRLRVDADGERLYTVGDALTYHFLPPSRLPEGTLEEICAMVTAGGTVSATHVRFNLQRAYLIGYVLEEGAIVGNSSLKNPRPEYTARVRRQSGLDLTGYVERGYTSVRPEYRGLGIGTKLLEGLTQRAGDRKIFSVISEDNQATQIIARRNRSRKVATYLSEKTGKRVGIWMPEWMVVNKGRKQS